MSTREIVEVFKSRDSYKVKYPGSGGGTGTGGNDLISHNLELIGNDLKLTSQLKDGSYITSNLESLAKYDFSEELAQINAELDGLDDRVTILENTTFSEVDTMQSVYDRGHTVNIDGSLDESGTIKYISGYDPSSLGYTFKKVTTYEYIGDFDITKIIYEVNKYEMVQRINKGDDNLILSANYVSLNDKMISNPNNLELTLDNQPNTLTNDNAFVLKKHLNGLQAIEKDTLHSVTSRDNKTTNNFVQYWDSGSNYRGLEYIANSQTLYAFYTNGYNLNQKAGERYFFSETGANSNLPESVIRYRDLTVLKNEILSEIASKYLPLTGGAMTGPID